MNKQTNKEQGLSSGIPRTGREAGGDRQHPAHARNRILGLMRSYELVDPDGIESVSRANQAAAFDRVSRSMRSCRTSRRSCASSSWSLLRSLSVRLP